MKVGLRVDVDTFRGTRSGVPSLLRAFERHGIKASIFFSVGPDNMGRHFWRLLKPVFLWKMLRTKAASLYGLDILLMGTMWPGPMIGKRNEQVIRDARAAGHEIGVHAWDHHYWQAHSGTMSDEKAFEHVRKAYDELTRILGEKPTCSASPGWRCTERLLEIKEKLPFRYNSDCRGSSIFIPVVNGKRLATPQIPLNLPTYDEVLGRNGITNENYNRFMIDKILANKDGMNVLTIHAEAEGGLCAGMFEDFLNETDKLGIRFCPLGELLPESVPDGKMITGPLPGREGWVALQGQL